MNTTVDALKNIYIQLGGDADDVVNISTIPEMLDAIREIFGSHVGAISVIEEKLNINS